MKVFNPLARSYKNKPLRSTYGDLERLKRRSYEQRVREIEHGTFTPLIFSASGGLGKAAHLTYRRLASLLSAKWNEHYNTVIRWMRCRISFSLLRSAISCLRSSRSTSKLNHQSISLVAVESRLNYNAFCLFFDFFFVYFVYSLISLPTLFSLIFILLALLS